MNPFFAELRRRNVFRVAAAYMVVGWLLMQFAALIETGLGLPAWFDAMIIAMLAIGFPVALLLAWAFEMTPEGMQKTAPTESEAGFRPLGNTDFVLIGLMVLVLGVVGFQMINSGPGEIAQTESIIAEEATTPITDIETVEAPVIDASIAVLPFADLSAAGDQQYFSDGIAEELLNSLAQFPDLRVAARTSAFSFRGDEVDLREVGEVLGVAHVLEGSVRQSGDRVRITAQLIRASDGFHLWSETYERTLTDIFDLQDEIVSELSRVLQVRLGVGAGTGRVGAQQVDPYAYEQYLRGLSLWGNRVSDENRFAAVRMFALSTEIDPDFVEGWAMYGVSVISSPARDMDMTGEEAMQLAFGALSRALELDPDNVRAHTGLTRYYLWSGSLDIERALLHARRAYEIAPNAAFTNYYLANTLTVAGFDTETIRAYERARSVDALNAYPSIYLSRHLGRYGRLVRLQALLDECPDCSSLRWFPMLDAALHTGSEAQAQTALLGVIARLEAGADSSPQSVEANLQLIAFIEDGVGVLLGIEGSGSVSLTTIAELDDMQAGFALMAVLTHLGEDERALDFLFARHLSGYALDFFLWNIHPGRYEFPEHFRRLPRYHEYWALPGMPELAAIRRANGQTGGLPLPMEPEE